MDVSGLSWISVPKADPDAIVTVERQLEETQWLPAEEIRDMQFRQLEGLLAHAVNSVPFYRKRLAPLAPFLPGTLDAERWREIPELKRIDIQETDGALISQTTPKDHGEIFNYWSSGSTGAPVCIKVTGLVYLVRRAQRRRFHAWYGLDYETIGANISDVFGHKKEAAESGKAIVGAATITMGPAFIRAANTPVRTQLQWLIDKRPEYLESLASNLNALLRHSEETDTAPDSIRLIAEYGEVCYPESRDMAERLWNARIVNVYGARELGLIALQCPENDHYHVLAENVLLEIVDGDGRPCGTGESGRVLLTDLNNFAHPLIRYDLGDFAEAGEPCPCGRGLPVVRRIVGRQRNMYRLPDGDLIVPSLRPSKFVKAAPALRQWQAVQKSVGKLEVKLVVTEPLTAADEEALRDCLTECLAGYRPDIAFTYVDDIPRSKSGKFDYFLSEIAP